MMRNYNEIKFFICSSKKLCIRFRSHQILKIKLFLHCENKVFSNYTKEVYTWLWKYISLYTSLYHLYIYSTQLLDSFVTWERIFWHNEDFKKFSNQIYGNTFQGNHFHWNQLNVICFFFLFLNRSEKKVNDNLRNMRLDLLKIKELVLSKWKKNNEFEPFLLKFYGNRHEK